MGDLYFNSVQDSLEFKLFWGDRTDRLIWYFIVSYVLVFFQLFDFDNG